MQRHSRGDTIVEVMIAFVVFSSIAVGAIAIMNHGTATAQKALEITLVRQQIDAQAETLRHIHDHYITANSTGGTVSTEWVEMVNDKLVDSASPFGADQDGLCPDIPSHAFVLNAHQANVWDGRPVTANESLLPYSQVFYDESGSIQSADGLWVESVGRLSDDYVDFNIRACWYAPGSSNASTMGTIVRLYVPRS